MHSFFVLQMISQNSLQLFRRRTRCLQPLRRTSLSHSRSLLCHTQHRKSVNINSLCNATNCPSWTREPSVQQPRPSGILWQIICAIRPFNLTVFWRQLKTFLICTRLRTTYRAYQRYQEKRRGKKNLFATKNNGIKQEKQRNNTEVSSQQAEQAYDLYIILNIFCC